YGHTLAHALEETGDYDLRHGEAVAVGVAFAAELAGDLGRIGDDRVAAHYRVLGDYDLSPVLPAGADTDQLVGLMARGKKGGGGLTLVLGRPPRVAGVPGVD